MKEQQSNVLIPIAHLTYCNSSQENQPRHENSIQGGLIDYNDKEESQEKEPL